MRPDFLSYKNSAAPELRLQFAEISLQQLLQLARPRHNVSVAFDPQKFWSRNFASVRDNVSLVVPISAASTRLVRSSLISTCCRADWRGHCFSNQLAKPGFHVFQSEIVEQSHDQADYNVVFKNDRP